jgi:hypothetical protein
MNAQEIALARRIIACGLSVPHHIVDTGCVIATLSTDENPERYYPGAHGFDPATRIMWQVVATGTGPKLLPVLDDFALLGWLILELESATGSTVEYMSTEDGWITLIDGEHNTISHKETRIEALVAALEAAQAAE